MVTIESGKCLLTELEAEVRIPLVEVADELIDGKDEILCRCHLCLLDLQHLSLVCTALA